MHSRIEEYQPAQKFDTVTARAFTALPDLLTKSRHLLVTGGKLLAMKSKEIDALKREYFEFESVQTLVVPELEAERNLVVYTAK